MPRVSESASGQRRVKLFKNGRNQAVRIPREFELPGSEALMRKDGGSLVIEPLQAEPLTALLRRLKPLRSKFPDVEDRPPEPVEI